MKTATTKKIAINKETLKNLKVKSSLKAGRATPSIGCTESC